MLTVKNLTKEKRPAIYRGLFPVYTSVNRTRATLSSLLPALYGYLPPAVVLAGFTAPSAYAKFFQYY